MESAQRYGISSDAIGVLGGVAFGTGVLCATGVPESSTLTSIFLITLGSVGIMASGESEINRFARGSFVILSASLIASLFVNLCQQKFEC